MTHQTNQGQTVEKHANDEIDLQQLLGCILEGRYIIVAFTVLFALAAFIFVSLSTPIYRANSYVLVEDTTQGIPGVDDTAQIIGSDSSSAKEIFVIKSRMVIGKVVDELDLTTFTSPNYFPLLGAAFARRHSGTEVASAPFGLDNYAWGGEKLSVSYLQVPRRYLEQPLELIALGKQRFSLSYNGQELLTGIVGEPAFGLDGDMKIIVDHLTARHGTQFEVKKLSRFGAILQIQSALLVSERGKDTGIIEIATEGADREQIARIVDSVANNYYSQNINRLAEEAESSLDFLDQQIQRVKEELAMTEEALNGYRSESASVDLSLETAATLDSLVRIEADISAMSIEEADLSRRYMPEHPKYIAFKVKQKNLIQQRDKLNSKMAKLPDMQKEVLRLTRDFETSQAIFISLDNRRQELSILKASTVGNVRLLDSAVVSPNTVAPKSKIILVLGTLLGGMVGLLIVFLHNFFRGGITDPKDFTNIGLAVHATIPYSENEQLMRQTDNLKSTFRAKQKIKKNLKYSLLANEYPNDSSLEALRSLRTSLRFLMINAKNNLVMISSGTPGVGKSFITINLAAVIAKSGQRVLIVDGDMRKSYLHRMFKVRPENGLSEILAGRLEVNAGIRKTMVDNLHFMPRGAVPHNPSELLMGSAIEKLAEELNEAYDLVLFDTPPILAVTDASIIGASCGTNMMVARFDTCKAKEVATANNRFALSGVDIKGVIFNAVQKKVGSYYYDEIFFYGDRLSDYHKPPATGQANVLPSGNSQ